MSVEKKGLQITQLLLRCHLPVCPSILPARLLHVPYINHANYLLQLYQCRADPVRCHLCFWLSDQNHHQPLPLFSIPPVPYSITATLFHPPLPLPSEFLSSHPCPFQALPKADKVLVDLSLVVCVPVLHISPSLILPRTYPSNHRKPLLRKLIL